MKDWLEMTWHELNSAAIANRPAVVVFGATEQHGPHLPLAIDILLPEAIARNVAEKIDGVLCPIIPIGYRSKPRSGGGDGFPGTLWFDAHTYINVVKQVIQGVCASGFRHVLVLNWHIENSDFIYEGCQLASAPDVKIIYINNPNALLSKTQIDQIFGHEFPGWDVEHAGIFETSLTLALYPEKVKSDKIVDDQAEEVRTFDTFPVSSKVLTSSGVLWHATDASREKGNMAFQWIVSSIIQIVRTEWADSLKTERLP